MAALCINKSRKVDLDKLENSQTALVTVSVAAFRVFEQEIKIQPDAMLATHSASTRLFVLNWHLASRSLVNLSRSDLNRTPPSSQLDRDRGLPFRENLFFPLI